MNLRSSHQLIKYGCVIRLLFSIKLLHLIVDAGKRQGSKSKHLKNTHFKEFELHLQFFSSTLHILYLVNTIGRTFVFEQGINNTCTSDNRTYIREGPIFNPILLLLHRRLATANLLGRSWKNLNCRFVNVLLC